MSAKTAKLRGKRAKALFLLALPAGVYGLAKAYFLWAAPKMPPCALRTLTGLRCPSCGMTHSAAALLRGDVPAALRENLMLPALALLCLLSYAECWLRLAGKKVKLLPRRGTFWLAFTGAWLFYSIARNLF